MIPKLLPSPSYGPTGSDSGPEVGFEDVIRRFPRSSFLESLRVAGKPELVRTGEKSEEGSALELRATAYPSNRDAPTTRAS
jgi:hypothetical protein